MLRDLIWVGEGRREKGEGRRECNSDIRIVGRLCSWRGARKVKKKDRDKIWRWMKGDRDILRNG